MARRLRRKRDLPIKQLFVFPPPPESKIFVGSSANIYMPVSRMHIYRISFGSFSSSG